MQSSYDVIVIGGGHAGTEAAWAAANALGGVGMSTGGGIGVRAPHTSTRPHLHTPTALAKRIALITMDPAKIGTMSCNPAIGGLAKGQIVREIDALGGLMGRATDATGIQFRMLNMSKGPAVRGPRAQCDKYAYAAEIQRLIATHPNIDVIAGTIDELIVEEGRVLGVVLPAGSGVVFPDSGTIEWNRANHGVARSVYSELPVTGTGPGTARLAETTHIRAHAVVLTTGTFMRALMHTGESKARGGRVGERSAEGISGMLRSLGFELGRLKTGTPPRLARESIDWESLPAQHGDDEPIPFSDLTPRHGEFSSHASNGMCERFPVLPQIECRTTHTTSESHDLIRANLDRAPMYSGAIEAECGPRYCPSIEDKVVRFAGREAHHVFLEPESLHTNEIYCNGISTSLPGDVQEVIVRTMPGCANANILRLGYAVEYDMVWPHQIDATCMTKRIAGLFLAGQINGTSGYEEAGGQGLLAGLNAARFAQELEPIHLGRDVAYIGVMMDDLVTKTPREPYRMFTSRAEHRLLLRADNADLRLTEVGRRCGLVDDLRWSLFTQRRDMIQTILNIMRSARVDGRTIAEIARRPEATVDDVVRLLSQFNGCNACPRALVERAMIDVQYEGYIARQQAEIKRQQEGERQRIPNDLDFGSVSGLRSEARDALSRFRPSTMGQAGRLAGVNPADLTLLAVALRRRSPQKVHHRVHGGHGE